MKTAISIPDELFICAERLAKRLGISRSALYQKAVSAYVEEHGEAGVTESLDALYGQGDVDSRLDPVLEALQGASLAREDWD